ncbi:MAG TPA: 2-oxoacid:acceptor oxidoreductase family protein [Candidatus Ozemobacteraceae bacterium]|nr:2-oxoacid:acceptor oxidoreductase family protein [Candidatus Ozemobacteraceae bacterium]
MYPNSEEIIMAGFGGQGILFLGKVLAEAGMRSGRHVSWIPSYGPEMRGGTANCTVVIAKEPIGSPMVNEPDCVLALNKPSIEKFAKTIRQGGVLVYNSSMSDQKPEKDGVKCIPVPASKIAEELGSGRVTNLVMVGAFAKYSQMVKFDDLVKWLPQIIPAKKKELAEINLNALKKGYEYVSSH